MLQAVPSVVAILLPAVILVRHPDAWWTTRTLLFGAILYAAVQGLIVLAEPLQPTFDPLTPANQDLPLVTLAEVYRTTILLVGVIGLAYIGLGLSLARRYVDVGPRWATAWFVPVATIFGTVVGVISVQGQFQEVSLTPPLMIYVASSVILGVMRIAVWAYLASVATRGWAAREDPRRAGAWRPWRPRSSWSPSSSSTSAASSRSPIPRSRTSSRTSRSSPTRAAISSCSQGSGSGCRRSMSSTTRTRPNLTTKKTTSTTSTTPKRRKIEDLVG